MVGTFCELLDDFTDNMQASESPNQKRKRGAPAGSPAAPNDASRRATRSRKADKETKATVDDERAEQETVAEDKENAEPGKRGRPRKGESKRASAEEDAARDDVRRSKRDRRSADDSPWWISGSNGAEEQEEEQGVSSSPPKKRARTSQHVITAEPKKQGVRSRRTDDTSPVQTRTTKSHRSSRPRTSPAAETLAQPEPGPKRRGCPRKSDVPATGDEEDLVEELAQPRKRGRPRLSNVSATGKTPSKDTSTNTPDVNAQRTEKAVTDDRRVPTTAQRRVSKNFSSQHPNILVGAMDDELEANLLPVPKYRHIEPRTRQIPHSTISAKWSPLDGASIETIATIISDTSRPVLLGLRDKELRHRQGQNILRIFAGRLRSKLRKGMPFPPPTSRPAGSKGDRTDAGGAHVEELNFESTVDSIESLETMLDPLLHSVALLEKEKAKEETALEKEYETLRTLESNAKAEARSWRERMKKAHPLAPEPLKQDGMPEVEGGNGEELALFRQRSPPLTGLFHVSVVYIDPVPMTLCSLLHLGNLERGAAVHVAANRKPYGEHTEKCPADPGSAPSDREEPSSATGCVTKTPGAATVREGPSWLKPILLGLQATSEIAIERLGFRWKYVNAEADAPRFGIGWAVEAPGRGPKQTNNPHCSSPSQNPGTC
jgi:hypothetical protein